MSIRQALRGTRRKILAALAAVSLLLGGVVLTAGPAAAAALQEVTSFGANPSALRMFLYVPAKVQPKAPIVVVVHYCHGDGQAMYAGSDFARLADQHGYIAIYPSVTRASDGCFDVASPQALTRGGGSDPVGIMSMVRYVQQNYATDTERVYATGVSSGAMMTNVLLGDYPDVFKAGAAFAGVPFGCFAGPNSWNSDCANGLISRTPQQWGDAVRAAYPGYTGPRPRMQLWHGTDDTVLHYRNFAEEIKQWTNVLGVSQTPVSTDSPQSGWTRTRYGTAGNVQVEAISLAGVPHNLPVNGAEAIRFFGLDKPAPSTSGPTPPSASPTSPSPTVSPSPSASPSPSRSAGPTPSYTMPPAPVGACRVGYTVNAWNTGLTAAITITNTGGTALNGWSLSFTLPAGQTITSGWNAAFAPAGGAVTARNAAYNGALAPGASVGVGFQATHTGDTAKPTAFSLNGVACTAG